MLCWEAAQFIKHTVVSGLLSLPALTASQRLFASRKYDRLYVYLSVCLCECACAEGTEEVEMGCICDLRYCMLWGGVDTVKPVQYTRFNTKGIQ